MDHDLMYVVINGEAIMIENGTAVSYLVDEDDGTIDWTAGDTVDWEICFLVNTRCTKQHMISC